MYNSVVLRTFTMLDNHHHYPSPGFFHHPKQKLCPLHSTVTSPSSQPQYPSLYFLLYSRNKTTPSYEWNHSVSFYVSAIFHWAYFQDLSMFKQVSAFLSRLRNIPPYINATLLCSPVGLFPLLALVNNAAVNMSLPSICLNPCFWFFCV